MLISITDSDLKNKARSDGFDIVFTDSDGTTKLDHEVESYNSGTGELIAWIRIPSLSSSVNNIIYIYYGNSQSTTSQENGSGVWDIHFMGVWHISETGTGTRYDSTGNINHGTPGNYDNDEATTGKIDGADDFGGSDDYIQTTSSESQSSTHFTWECWFKTDTVTNPHHLIWEGIGTENGYGAGQEAHLSINWYNQNNVLACFYGANEANSVVITTPFSDTTTYHHAAFVMTDPGTTPVGELFLDGSSVGTDTGTDALRTTWDTNLRIGSPGANQRYFDGIIDEVRVSNTTRSAEWIDTEYNNLNSPSTFSSMGEEQVGYGYEWVELYNADTSAIDLSGWTLTDNDGNTFNLTGAGTIPIGEYLVCHFGQDGINSTTNVYGPIIGAGIDLKAMLEDNDDLALVNSTGTIVDYVAWGGDPGVDDDAAVTDAEWSDGDYVDTSALAVDETLARDKDSTDMDSKSNWEDTSNKADPFGINATAATLGGQNLYPNLLINEVLFYSGSGKFENRKLITIDHTQVSADLTDFPVLIHLTSDSDLAANAQNDGDDIVFIKYSDNSTQLSHEIQSFDGATGELVAWVNVSSLSSSEVTKFWMYYGNSTCGSQENIAGTWNSGYEIVWHLQESGGGTTDEYKDSTSNAIHGTGGKDDDSSGLGDATETPTRLAGKFGYAQDFNDDGATGDRISSKDLPSAWSAVTGSVWIYGNSAGDDRLWGKSWGQATTDNSVLLRCTGTGANTLGSRFRTDTSSNTGYDPATMQNNVWINYVLTWDGSTDDTVRIYRDGVFQGSGAVVSGNTLYASPPHEFFTLGNVGDGAEDRCFNGYIQEARMSSISRSASWIATEYNNQNSPSIFYNVSTEQNLSKQWVELYNSGSLSLDLTGCKLSDNDGNSFNLSGVSNLPSSGYLVCYLGQTGINSSSSVYGPIENASATPSTMFENSDDLVLLNGEGTIIDYIAWGADSGTDDDAAVTAGEWTNGEYIDTSELLLGETIGRDKDSTDTNTPSDWENSNYNTADPFGIDSNITTPGAQNLYDIPLEYSNVVINEVMFKPATSGWKYRKMIAFNSSQVTGDLTNFPVLIKYRDPDLPTHARSDGYDIYFTSSDGQSRLNHEIEKYDNTTGELIVWVNVTSLSGSTDTVLYMYYGNPSASDQSNPAGVWDINFTNILHLSEVPDGSYEEIQDSTKFGNNGTTYGGMDSSDSVKARIGSGLKFDEINDYIQINDSSSLDTSVNAATIQLWVWWNNTEDGDHQIIMSSSNRFTAGFNDGFEWASQGDGNHFFYPWGGDNMNYNLGPNPFTNRTWHHMVVTLNYSGKDVDIYVDGNAMPFNDINVPTQWTQLASPNDWLWGGNTDRPTRHFNGTFDEIRVSNIVRSQNWIQTEFNNQNRTNDFYDIYREELIGYQWVELYNANNTGVNLNGWTLKDNDGNSYELTGAGTIPSGGYLICHMGQSGTNSSTNVYGYPGNIFGTSDDLGLYTTMNNIVDYIAWGADAGTDDDRAALLGFWTNSEFIDTSSLIENETIGRDKDSIDTNATADWENVSTNEADPYGVNATHGTPGAQNIDYIIPEFEILALPMVSITIIITFFKLYFKNKVTSKRNLKKKNLIELKKR